MGESIYAMMRDKPRFNVNIQASYIVKKHGKQQQECQLTNLSASGAAVLMPCSESLDRGSVILVNIPIPNTIMHHVAEAEIMWARQRFNKWRTGIRFMSMLSDNMVHRLAQSG